MKPELICWIHLPGRKVEVRMTVHGEPELPTPLEPECKRLPLVNEWADITGRLATMQIDRIQTIP